MGVRLEGTPVQYAKGGSRDARAGSTVIQGPRLSVLHAGGRIQEWDPHARRLRILNVDVLLGSRLPPDALASGLVVLVQGHYDETTGDRIATRLRQDWDG